MSQNIAEPKCPECKIQGIKFITKSDSEITSKGGDTWFDIVHCTQCGHVYGVYAKVVYPPKAVPMPRPF